MAVLNQAPQCGTWGTWFSSLPVGEGALHDFNTSVHHTHWEVACSLILHDLDLSLEAGYLGLLLHPLGLEVHEA